MKILSTTEAARMLDTPLGAVCREHVNERTAKGRNASLSDALAANKYADLFRGMVSELQDLRALIGYVLHRIDEVADRQPERMLSIPEIMKMTNCTRATVSAGIRGPMAPYTRRGIGGRGVRVPQSVVAVWSRGK